MNIYSYAQIQHNFIKRIQPVMRIMRKQVDELRQIDSGDSTACCACLKKQLISARLFSQITVEQYNYALQELHGLQRINRKSKSENITILPLRVQISKQKILVNELYNQLADCGRIVTDVLDAWQIRGGTLSELVDICCCNPLEADVIEKLEPNLRFSRIVATYRLDFRSHLPWNEVGIAKLTLKDFAPMTHAIQEYDRRVLQEGLGFSLEQVLKYGRNAESDDTPLSDKAKQHLIHVLRIVYADKNTVHPRFKECQEICFKLMAQLRLSGYANIKELETYFSECTSNDMEEWLDMICPRIVSKREIVKILSYRADE